MLVQVAHGSAVFERGETQALCTATLGAMDISNTRDQLSGRRERNRLFFAYEFPPFSTGEVRVAVSDADSLADGLER